MREARQNDVGDGFSLCRVVSTLDERILTPPISLPARAKRPATAIRPPPFARTSLRRHADGNFSSNAAEERAARRMVAGSPPITFRARMCRRTPERGRLIAEPRVAGAEHKPADERSLIIPRQPFPPARQALVAPTAEVDCARNIGF